MPKQPSADAAYCYRRAEENRRMAEQATDAAYRECCLDLEQRWLKLALSYEYSDRINDFAARLVCKHDELYEVSQPQNSAQPQPRRASAALRGDFRKALPPDPIQD